MKKKIGSRLETSGARRKPLRAPTQSFTASRLSPDGTSNCGGVLTGTQKSEVRISSRNRPASKVDSASTRARHPSKLWWRDCRAFVTMSATEACHRGREQGQLEHCRYRGRHAAARGFNPDACGWGNDCFASVSPLCFFLHLVDAQGAPACNAHMYVSINDYKSMHMHVDMEICRFVCLQADFMHVYIMYARMNAYVGEHL